VKVLWLIISFFPRWALEIVLWFSYVLWRIWDLMIKALAGPRNPLRSCLGCLLGIPTLLIYFVLTLISTPFFVLYMIIGRIDIAMENAGEPGITPRLDVARATFFWPSILLFWLMPKLYGVEIVVPPETTLGLSLVYVLRDLKTGETVPIRPGPKSA